MISIKDNVHCSGCEACYNACPVNAISMFPDPVEGFFYPEVDLTVCINCGLCEQVCPMLSERHIQETVEVYAVQHFEEAIRKESSSGGAFSAIAQRTIERGGLVFGAAYDSEFNVKHRSAESVSDLSHFRGSKYVQSRIDKTFQEAKTALLSGREVCFSGTPCQIEGLVKFLGKPYPQLITVDIVCHGVPSPQIYRKYLDYHQRKYGSLKEILFRDKNYGYAGSTMALRFADGRKLTHGRELQFFKDTFFNNLSTRPSCYACHFKTVERVADFTIFDCWHVRKWDKKMDDDLGTTFVLAHSKKGQQVFREITSSLRYCQVPLSEAIESDGDMAIASIPQNPQRNSFFEDATRLPLPLLMKRYIPLTLSRQIILWTKPIIYKLNLLPLLKRIFYR